MRKLWTTSFLAIAILTALLITVATVAELFMKVPSEFMQITVGICLTIVLLQFLLAPYYIRVILKIGWHNPSEVSPEFGEWYAKTAAELKIGNPAFGIIESGMPNAFTFGRFVKDARVVVTRGLIDSLDEQELQAVVTHEFGHIRNRDFVAMTVVQAIVLLIYYGARVLLNNSNSHAKVAGVLAYGIYWVAQLGALAFSRIREFMADRVSAETTHNPDALASALIKIGYGLARIKTEQDEAIQTAVKVKGKKSRSKQPVFGAGALGAWGIANVATYNAVAGWTDADGKPSQAAFAMASAWDLKNGWARYSELLSTHPLIARRVSVLMALPESRRSFQVGKFEKPNWGRFAREWVIYSFPALAMLIVWLSMLSGEIGNPLLLSGGFAVLFAAMMARMSLVYPKQGFKDVTVTDLLADTESSHVSPIPCRLHGKFVTRAEGGLWWSSNLVFQDETGIVVAQRKMFLPSFLTRWGWMRAKQFVGNSEVVLTGWYRRFGHPAIEIDRIDCEATGEHFKSPYWTRSLMALGVGLAISLCVLAGAFLV